MPAEPLTLSEREEIRAGIERGEPLVTVAGRLGRHRGTVSGEVARNGGRALYRAVLARCRADSQRARPKVPVLVADPVLAAHVTTRLHAKDSPDANVAATRQWVGLPCRRRVAYRHIGRVR
jgi:IS30 family transposase